MASNLRFGSMQAEWVHSGKMGAQRGSASMTVTVAAPAADLYSLGSKHSGLSRTWRHPLCHLQVAAFETK